MIEILPVTGIPDVKEGDDLGRLIVEKFQASGDQFKRGDIIIVSQKIVSKAEGRIVAVSKILPSIFARTIAKQTGKDPRHVEAVLGETKTIIRMGQGHLITETRHGFICANAGVDQSNTGRDKDSITLLPKNSDTSAGKIRKTIYRLTRKALPVIITDTFGRPWRVGQVNFAIGVSGMKPIQDYRGTRDMYKRILQVTEIAVADELACAAELVMNKADRIPVAVIRGYKAPRGYGRASDLIRPAESDLFR